MTLTGILTDGLASAYDEINHIFLDFWILISIFAEVINKFFNSKLLFFKKTCLHLPLNFVLYYSDSNSEN